MNDPRSCRGFVVLLTGPIIAAAALSMAFVGETAEQPVSMRVLLLGLGLAFAGGWLFVLSGWVPERFARIPARAAFGVLGLALTAVTVGLLWDGSRRILDGGDTTAGLIMLGIGALFAIATTLLLLRRWLPWNRGVPLPTGRDVHARRTGSTAFIADRGGRATLHLDASMPLREVRDEAGRPTSSRVAWMLEEAGESTPPLAMTDDFVVPPGRALVVEHPGGARRRVAYLLPDDSLVVESLRRRAAEGGEWPEGREGRSAAEGREGRAGRSGRDGRSAGEGRAGR
ncbi:MAG: hypothetical protein GXX90_00395 [Microbacteriaceae bacterium]|nr:hypothetical protein [Microbacteriaceae bacterium]